MNTEQAKHLAATLQAVGLAELGYFRLVTGHVSLVRVCCFLVATGVDDER